MAAMSRNGRRPPLHTRSGTTPAAPTWRRDSTLTRWGNSLGVRIPQGAADRLKLKPGVQVSVEVGPNAITIRPLRPRRKWSEAELLKGVTPAMVGGEVDWRGPVGREIG